MGEVVTFDNTSDNQAAIHYQKANKNEANSITTAQEGMFKKKNRVMNTQVRNQQIINQINLQIEKPVDQ